MPEDTEQGRLKVLFLPDWYPQEGNPLGGIYIQEHAKAASLYNEVTVIYVHHNPSYSAKGRYGIFDNMEEGIRTLRVKWKQSPIPRTSFLFRLRGLHACFRQLTREGWKPDIIHAHIFPAAVPAVILGRVYGIPVVITEHWSRFILGEMTLFDRLRARFAMNRARTVIPVSDRLRKGIEAYGIRSRFQVVPNTVNSEMFYPLPSGNGLTRKNTEKRILMVASLAAPKGCSYLLEALAQIKESRQDFILDIVGDGPNRSECEELARKLGLDEVVRFHGQKSKQDVAEFMMRCDFFVQPSLFETFGVVYIEAMACGKPVIASDIEGPRDIINSEEGILVPPKNVKALAKAIDYMLDNHQNYSPVKIAQYARERFSYEVVGGMLDNIYRRVISGKIEEEFGKLRPLRKQ